MSRLLPADEDMGDGDEGVAFKGDLDAADSDGSGARGIVVEHWGALAWHTCIRLWCLRFVYPANSILARMSDEEESGDGHDDASTGGSDDVDDDESAPSGDDDDGSSSGGGGGGARRAKRGKRARGSDSDGGDSGSEGDGGKGGGALVDAATMRALRAERPTGAKVRTAVACQRHVRMKPTQSRMRV